jgi:oxygen-independent coproporphyrinogen-3 oxidase
MTKSSPFSLYVHVPFCAHKCPYCDFNTYATPRLPEADYVEALSKELRRFGLDPRFRGREIATVFFGGGTPSLLSAEAVSSILRAASEQFPIVVGAEITLEANLGDVTCEKLQAFSDAGVNRLSYGVQSFDDERLKLLGRDHTAQQAIDAVSMARQVGIANISVDIIFGTPGQTLADLERDVHAAASLPIAHLSTYSLTIEPGTPFFQRQERGLLVMPGDSLVAQMLERLPEIASGCGFARYEISNYARDGKESAHNNVYWTGGDYLGVGAGAHSYVATWRDGVLVAGDRWSTVALPQTYIRDAGSSRVTSWSEKIEKSSLWFEFFYVGLRRISGVSASEFQKRFDVSLWDTYGDVARDLEGEGFLLIDENRISLTKRGVAVADSVFERFVQPTP